MVLFVVLALWNDLFMSTIPLLIPDLVEAIPEEELLNKLPYPYFFPLGAAAFAEVEFLERKSPKPYFFSSPTNVGLLPLGVGEENGSGARCSVHDLVRS